MKISAKAGSLVDILPWRDMYRQEMRCQIVHDSLHARDGWAQPYLLRADDELAGYGSILVGGPWTGSRTAFEFFVLPRFRSLVFDLFDSFLQVSEATAVQGQTNDALFCVLLHHRTKDIRCEKIVFEDKLTTTHALAGAVFRKLNPEDVPKVFTHQREPVGEWLLEMDGTIAATGGIAFHYNRPYGDIFMEVEESSRKRGLGCFLVQELKRVCYEGGSVPCARCDPTNTASLRTLQKAGLVPCAEILLGTVSPTT